MRFLTTDNLRGLLAVTALSLGGAEAAPRPTTVTAVTPPLSLSFEIGVAPSSPELVVTRPFRGLRLTPVKSGFAQLRYGVAVDLALPGSGNFDLTFTHRRNLTQPPQRYRFQLDRTQPLPAAHLWSVSAIVGRGRHGNILQAVPQFVVDLNQLTGLPGDGEIILQYCPWRPTEGEIRPAVPQVSVNWRF